MTTGIPGMFLAFRFRVKARLRAEGTSLDEEGQVFFFSFYTYRQSTSLRNNVIAVNARRLRYVAVIALTVDLCRGRTSRDCAHGTPRSPNCVVAFAVGSTHIYKSEC